MSFIKTVAKARNIQVIDYSIFSLHCFVKSHMLRNYGNIHLSSRTISLVLTIYLLEFTTATASVSAVTLSTGKTSSTGEAPLTGALTLYTGGMSCSRCVCCSHVSVIVLLWAPAAAAPDNPIAMTESAAALLATTLMPRLLMLYVAAVAPTAVRTMCSVNWPASLPYLYTDQSLLLYQYTEQSSFISYWLPYLNTISIYLSTVNPDQSALNYRRWQVDWQKCIGAMLSCASFFLVLTSFVYWITRKLHACDQNCEVWLVGCVFGWYLLYHIFVLSKFIELFGYPATSV